MLDPNANYYSTKEVCDELRIARSTLFRMADRGTVAQPVRLSKFLVRWPGAPIRSLLDTEASNDESTALSDNPATGKRKRS